MSSYFKKGKGWRYDFTLKGIRYTETWFKTKKEARQAEAAKREELQNPVPVQENKTDMGFLELVNLRLDYVKAYNTSMHYQDHCYTCKKWIARWGKLSCREISSQMIERFILERNKVSAITANKEIRFLRALFNFGKKKKWIKDNPVDGIEFLPVERKIKYVPPVEDIRKVIETADPDTRDYLIMICDTMARVGEINRLCWDDVSLYDRYVVLYTRKKRGGHLTPRKVPMTLQVHRILLRRYEQRDPKKPWVFWHRYLAWKEGVWKEGPYKYRGSLMAGLCKAAGVPPFTFHALRHAGASTLENNHVPIGSIQRILGHENRTTTEIYLHCLAGAEYDAIKVLERSRSFSHTDPHMI